MRKCSKCKVEKPLNDFYKQKSNKSGYQSQCKECQTKGAIGRYSERKDKIKKRTVENNNKLRDRNYNFVHRYLNMFGECVDCGVKDSRVLEFDHVRGIKYKGVKRMCADFNSIDNIKNEIRKCEVRCCNCHRIKTINTLGWRQATPDTNQSI